MWGATPAAQALAWLLAREGIAQQYVFPVAEHSGRGAGLVDAAGENSIAVFPGANMDIGAPQIAQAAQAIGSASLVYGQLEMAADAVLAAFTVARAQGIAHGAQCLARGSDVAGFAGRGRCAGRQCGGGHRPVAGPGGARRAARWRSCLHGALAGAGAGGNGGG